MDYLVKLICYFAVKVGIYVYLLHITFNYLFNFCKKYFALSPKYPILFLLGHVLRSFRALIFHP